MLEYARWKYILVGTVLVLACLFALPNLFGSDPALQVAREDRAAVTAEAQQRLEAELTKEKIGFERSYIENGRLMMRFDAVPDRSAS